MEPRNRWSVYKNVKDEYIIVREAIDHLQIVTPYSYIHAVRDGEDLEPFANNNYDTIDKFLFEKLLYTPCIFFCACYNLNR